MTLINVQISIQYYPPIIKLDVQNCQLSIKVHFLECYGRQELYASSYSFLLWMFLSIQRFSSIPIKRNLDLTSLGHHDTSSIHRVVSIYLGM